jgi:hypothetical protein
VRRPLQFRASKTPAVEQGSLTRLHGALHAGRYRGFWPPNPNPARVADRLCCTPSSDRARARPKLPSGPGTGGSVSGGGKQHRQECLCRLPSPDEWHVGGHDGHELNVGA